MKKGDIVRIRREWCDSEEERRYIYIVVEDYGNGRCVIECQTTGMAIKPQETVSEEMIEKTDIRTAALAICHSTAGYADLPLEEKNKVYDAVKAMIEGGK